MKQFGIEVEFTGIKMKEAANIAHEYLKSTTKIMRHIFSYVITDQQGREWKIDNDQSIKAEWDEQCELITPILHEEDLPLLKGLLETLKAAGAKSSDKLGCGIHIHIDGTGHTPETIRNLTNIMAAHEDQLFRAFYVPERRYESYCKPVGKEFLEELNKQKPKNFSELADLWYKEYKYLDRADHHNPSRYHALNIHAFLNPYGNHTLEFRFGQWTEDTSFDWIPLESFIRVCQAINEMALKAKSASPKRQKDWTSAYTFRCWLLRLGFIGDETREIRKFLLEGFEGDKAWKRAA